MPSARSTRLPVRGHRRTGLAAVVASALLLVGCTDAGAGADGNADGAAAPGDQAYGGTLSVGFAEDATNYDPHQRPQLVARTVSRQIADLLTEQDPETGEILPWLAQDWEVSDDVTEFTFHLRDDVTFSDGTDLNAEVVAANFDRIIDIGPLAFVAAGLLRGYVESEVVDEHTVTVRFEEPNAQFLQATSTHSLSILAEATLELDPEEVAAGNVIGSGPYVLESYDPNAGIALSVREDYAWGSPLTENEGRGYFDEIEFSFLTEATTLAGSLTSGQVDYAYPLNPSSVPSVEAGNAELVPVPMPAIAIPIVPLLHRDIVADEGTRRALSLATDREAIVNSVFQGLYTPAKAVLTTSNPGYVDLGEELQHDPAAAEALLEDAGWTEISDDGIRTNADGDRLSLEIQYTSDSVYETMFQLLQQQWAQVGIEFVLTPVADLSDYTIHDYPFELSTWSQTRADPDVLRTVYSSFYENQSFLFGHADDDIDALLGDLQATVDTDERLAVSEEVQRLLIERGYTVPLYDLVQYSGVGADLAGVLTDIEGKPLFVDLHRAP